MRRRRRTHQIQMAILAVATLLVTVGVILGLKFILEDKGYLGGPDDSVETGSNTGDSNTDEESEEAKKEAERQKVLQQAERLAASYDYDGAIALLESFEGYETDSKMVIKINEYKATKAACVKVNIDEVTHIFYHSLVVDPERCFANQETNSQAAGNNQWMTTIDEFKKITQEMYDRGFVLVSIHDLYDVTTDENGNEVWKKGTIMLPEGKKAFVLSVDDLSYYHSYDGYGYASKLVLDEEGNVVCEYIQADGTTVVGAYDVVPLLDQFIEEHPDASYRGAKGMIALTGYNGVFGYRTDISYQEVPDDLDADKKKWLKNNPDFDLAVERAEATKIAEALKESGWEFASHTWGHLRVGSASLASIQRDTTRWKENVELIVGKVDTIIFAHGQDIGNWGKYSDSNEKFQYLMDQGFHIFCNVDSHQYLTYIGKNYMRQGRRNLDGYRIYYNSIGEQNNLSDLFDAEEIIDPLRPPVLPL